MDSPRLGPLLLVDLGVVAAIRGVAFFINGHLLAQQQGANATASGLIPQDWVHLDRPNRILAVITESPQMTLWLGGGAQVTPTSVDSAGGVPLADLLPSQIWIMDTEPMGIGSVHTEPDRVRIVSTDGATSTITIHEDGVIRVRGWEQDQVPLADRWCLAPGQPGAPLPVRTEASSVGVGLSAAGLTIDWQGEAGVIRLSDNEEWSLNLRLYRFSPTSSGRFVAFSADISGERIFGFGEHATPHLDRTGTGEDMWVQHRFVECDIPVPFGISTGGYGIFVNNSFHGGMDAGARLPGRWLGWFASGPLDLFIIRRHRPLNIISTFTRLVGRPQLPPRWAFGLWQSTTRPDSQDDYLGTIARFDALQLPLDVVAIDPVWQEAFNQLEWNSDDYPNPAAFLRALADQEIALCLWTSPFQNQDSSLHDEVAERGLAIRSREGVPLKVQWWLGRDALALDFSNSEAVEWWQRQIGPLIDAGVDVLKLDGGDAGEIPAEAVAGDGRTAQEWHNLYPLMMAEATLAQMRRRHPGRRNIIWQRTGFAGSGRYACTWGGDQVADFSGARVLVKAGQAAGTVGIPFWAPDVGGFADDGDKQLDFVIRSWQWGMFAPLARAHGGSNEPWAHGPRAEAIIASFIRLRYSLLPYLYTHAHRAAADGTPIMRPMWAHDPSDTNARSADLQFYLGDDLLIAPIVEPSAGGESTTSRPVWIPPGTWYDLFDDTRVTGPGWIEVSVGIDRLPVWVRGGAILPRITPAVRARWGRVGALQLHHYGDIDGVGEMIEDDGVSLGYQQGELVLTRFSVRHQGDLVHCRVEADSGGFSGHDPVTRIDWHLHGDRMTEVMSCARDPHEPMEVTVGLGR